MYREAAQDLIGKAAAVFGGRLWKIVAIVSGAIAIACLVIAWRAQQGYESERKAHRSTESALATQRVSLAMCESAVTTYNVMIETQNKSIADLKADGARRQDESEKALAALRADAAKRVAVANRRADALAKPTPGGADCKAAVSLVRKELKP
jgi:uncharacterized protein YlxW (UPF0749 family)